MSSKTNQSAAAGGLVFSAGAPPTQPTGKASDGFDELLSIDERALDLLFYLQQHGRIWIEHGQLRVSPMSQAQRHRWEIRSWKKELARLLGHCPQCLAILRVEHIEHSRHRWCLNLHHYDEWTKKRAASQPENSPCQNPH